MIREHEAEWIAAVCKDVGKPPVEADVLEISTIYSAASYIISNLKSWMNPEPHQSMGVLFPASCEVCPTQISGARYISGFLTCRM